MKRSIAAVSATVFALGLTAALSFANPTTHPASAYPLTTDVVTGEPLGEKPVVETIAGREVRFANAANAEKFKAGGEEMQKKMDEQVVAALKDKYPVKVCIVSDEELGGMGDPIMFVNRPTNQLVEFCCSGCVKKFKKDPAKYLPKLEAGSQGGK